MLTHHTHRHRFATDPVRLLEPELLAVEAVFPKVEELHQQKLDRVARLSGLVKSTADGPALQLKVSGCKELKKSAKSSGGRLPNPFVVATFIKILDGGTEGEVLHMSFFLGRQ